MAVADEIWKRLADSGLVTGGQVASVRTEFEHERASAKPGGDLAEGILAWLVSQNRISEYQHQVLASGRTGPFQFDDYLVHATGQGPLVDSFRARHVPTGHPVRLFFFGGQTIEDGQAWQSAMQLARSWRPVQHPGVWQIFEAVTTGEYRFLVTSAAQGQTMLEKIPRKGRLPWKHACQAAEYLANGIAALEKHGLVHGRLSPASVWIRKSGACQIIPPLVQVDANPPDLPTSENGDPLSGEHRRRHESTRFLPPGIHAGTGQVKEVRSDLFGLGQITFRLIAGRVKRFKSTSLPERLQELESLSPIWEKYNVAEPLQSLVRDMLTADVQAAPPDARSIAERFHDLPDARSTVSEACREPSTYEPFVSAIEQRNRSSRFFEELETRLDNFPAPTGDQPSDGVDLTKLQAGTSVFQVRDRVARREQSRSKHSAWRWMAVTSLVLLTVTTTVLVSGLGKRDTRGSKTQPPDTAASPDSIAAKPNNQPDTGTQPAETGDSNTDPAETGSPVQLAVPASSQWLEQTVEDQDQDLAWESPTAGPPLDSRWLPPAPEFVFAWQPARVLQNPGSNRVLRATGPVYESLTARWLALSGISLDRIAHMTVSLHPANGQYEIFVNATLLTPEPAAELLSGMPGLTLADTPEPGATVYSQNDWSICLVQTGSAHNVESENPGEQPEPIDESAPVDRILAGTGNSVSSMFSDGGLAACDRYLARIIQRSDRHRDFNLLFLNSALTSEEGTWLFSGDLARLRRPLHLFFDERVRAVMLSGHLDRGSYLELMTSQTVDLKDREAAKILAAQLETFSAELTTFVDQYDAHGYWEKLRVRFGKMLNEVATNTRVVAERDGVIANCWLPVASLHNLVAGSELVLADAGFARDSEPHVPFGPRTLADLLASSRTLELSNSPDLRVLLENLQAEIRGDFPDVPFEFTIRLLGDDLQADGITQNQRPGDIAVHQKPLADILTTIMFQANPDKDATGPADERCKLVWVTGPDPDRPDRQIVLITTRAAAATRGLELPAAFVSE